MEKLLVIILQVYFESQINFLLKLALYVPATSSTHTNKLRFIPSHPIMKLSYSSYGIIETLSLLFVQGNMNTIRSYSY